MQFQVFAEGWLKGKYLNKGIVEEHAIETLPGRSDGVLRVGRVSVDESVDDRVRREELCAANRVVRLVVDEIKAVKKQS